MPVINYFYKDSTTNIYMINGNAVPKGNYKLNSYNSDTIIEIVSKINNISVLGPIEISNLRKETDTNYTDLSEILTDNSTFF